MKNLSSLLAWTLSVLALMASPSLAQSIYEPYTFTTLAGSVGNSGSTDGTGSDARFNAPFGVAVDSVGNVYVADSSNHTIRKITPAGLVTTLAGSAGSLGYSDGKGTDARFSYPGGLTVDSAGNVYVADIRTGTIRRVTPAGVVTTLAGLAFSMGDTDGTGMEARFNYPNGVTVDGDGNVYVADTGNNGVRKVTLAGVVTTLAGNAEIYDFFGHRTGGDADGTGRAAQFRSPNGVAVDGAGNVYVSDYFNRTIRKVTPAGVVTTLAGLAWYVGSKDGTGKAARFNGPAGVAVDSAGNVYVADSGNHSIRRVRASGEVTTLAGNASVIDQFGNPAGGYADGTGKSAQFQYPSSVAVDSVGNVYVADSLNHTIRKGYPAARILNSGPGFGFNGGQFGFNLTGPAGRSVVVESSPDLVNWLPLWTNTFTLPASLNFRDPQSGVSSARFYRARLP